jgi:hypothetical protein
MERESFCERRWSLASISLPFRIPKKHGANDHRGDEEEKQLEEGHWVDEREHAVIVARGGR